MGVTALKRKAKRNKTVSRLRNQSLKLATKPYFARPKEDTATEETTKEETTAAEA